LKFKFTAILGISVFLLSSCELKKSQDYFSKFNSRENRVVIWTNCSEFAQYIELYNKTSKENRAILVYKDNPALSIPPAKDEIPPDIIVGSWLRTDSAQKYFRSLDYLFDRQNLSSSMFYANLLESGKVHHKQLLLPVSFNLPAVIFDKTNGDLITDNYILSLDEIKEISGKYNKTKKNGDFSRIGFAPLNHPEFLALASKLFSSDFREVKNEIVWNQENLQKTVDYFKDWVSEKNKSAKIEEDFSFKYLFMPYYRQVTSGRTLFSSTTSDVLLKNLHDQELPIDYRWIAQDGKIPMDDSFLMMGIYKDTKNQPGASEFITWFFNTETQRQIIERKEVLLLETEMFGIAGGFSSIRDVTEHVLPVYYTQLLSNLPPAQMLSVPQKLPARWESYKTLVIEPYLLSSITTETDSQETPDIKEFEREWRKKVFD